MFLLYIPLGYATDNVIYRFRQRRRAQAKSLAMDVRMFTVGPVAGEQLHLPPRRLRPRADRRPRRRGRHAARTRSTSSGVTLDGILLTHTHFDHVGAVAPVAKATGAEVWVPEIEKFVLARHQLASCPGPASGRSSARTPSTRSRAARSSSWRASRSTCSSRRATAPGHVTFSIPDEQALFSGDVLFQGSVGRTDLPGGDWPTLLESIRTLSTRCPRSTTVYPGPHGHHDASAPSAPRNPFLAELAR